MKKILKMLGIIALVAVIGFSMAACDDGAYSDELSGSYSRYVYHVYSSYPVSVDNYTDTISFTGNSSMTFTRKGYLRGQAGVEVDQKYDGTYIYSHKTKEGVITCSAFTAGLLPFSLDTKNGKLKSLASSDEYSLKK